MIDGGPGGEPVPIKAMQLAIDRAGTESQTVGRAVSASSEKPVPTVELVVISHLHMDHVGGIIRHLRSCWRQVQQSDRKSNLVGSSDPRILKVVLADSRDIEQVFVDAFRENTEGKPLNLIYAIKGLAEAQRSRGEDVSIELETNTAPTELFARHSLTTPETDDVPELHLLYPSRDQHADRHGCGTANDISAILLLDYAGHRVVFPGDATLPGWRDSLESAPDILRDINLVAVPHHGGQIAPRERDPETALKTLYQHLFSGKPEKPRYAFISVGTEMGAKYGHPRQDVIDALRSANVHILCSQFTRRCLKDDVTDPEALARELHKVREFTLHAGHSAKSPRHYPGKSEAFPGDVRKGNVGCASTVIAELKPNCEFQVFRRDRHIECLNSLHASPLATSFLCRT
ncbi:MAG: hypothetical protein O3A00_10865 [Planctomycetota bacterium]|nr:hypothetical protein [Planctomycetota bacterium]